MSRRYVKTSVGLWIYAVVSQSALRSCSWMSSVVCQPFRKTEGEGPAELGPQKAKERQRGDYKSKGVLTKPPCSTDIHRVALATETCAERVSFVDLQRFRLCRARRSRF